MAGKAGGGGTSETARALRAAAERLPGVEEGIACKGTALECRTFKAGRKAFLFLGVKDARLKLQASQGEARRLAAAEPERYAIGANGWATIRFGADGAPPPRERLVRWVDESHRAVAPAGVSAAAGRRAGAAGSTARGSARRASRRGVRPRR